MNHKQRAFQMMKRGFTLIEIVIVLAVIAVLAAFLIPTMWGHSEKSRALRAMNDCKTIAEAIMNFYQDTRAWPVYSDSATTPVTPPSKATIDVLFTDGNEAELGSNITGWPPGGNRSALQDHLEKGRTSGGQSYPTALPFAWKGPYLTDFKSDPWGSKYYINATYLQPGSANNAVWVLSAGPNGLIETNFTQPVSGTMAPSLGGDDIGYRIK